MPDDTISTYTANQRPDVRQIMDALRREIDAALPDAESKCWHGAPVWFLAGNPVVGYAARKTHVNLLFWSGQSFDEPGLRPEGSFKAAEAHYRALADVDVDALRQWLAKCRAIQWDYKNIVKRKGRLERLS